MAATVCIRKSFALMAENWNNRSGIKNDHFWAFQHSDRLGVRRRNWACALAGATCMAIGPWAAAEPTPEMLSDMAPVQLFMESVPDFNAMKPYDSGSAADSQWVLADIGKSYVVYSWHGDAVALKHMIKGEYRFQCIKSTSGPMIVQTLAVDFGANFFKKTSGFEEAVVYLSRK